MMLRITWALAVLVAAWPCEQGFAQVFRPHTPIGDVRLSLFASYSPSFARSEDRIVTLSDRVVSGRFESSYPRGYGGGAIVEVLSVGRLRALTSLTYLQRAGETVERNLASDTIAVRPGSSFVVASVGLSLRLGVANPDMHNRDFNVSLRAGPAYAVEIPMRDANGEKLRPLSALGANFGIEAEVPIGRIAALQMAVDDLMHFPDGAELARRVDESFARQGLSTSSKVSAAAIHVLVLRVGIGFTFQ